MLPVRQAMTLTFSAWGPFWPWVTVPVASPLMCQVPARRSRACIAVSGCRGSVLMPAVSCYSFQLLMRPSIGQAWA